MRRFHPLLPLTESGHVMVAAALSMFAALALIAWEPLQGTAAPVACAGTLR